ncbi:hypothetical protein F5X99DRAFT_386189 [Biscogniauxia marginata]|nr:hypothetical protein F5X99DRAFT_386189 [Biscogniauxia marginata]
MLDENLPTFYFRQSDNPLSSLLYFTQNGSEPTAEYSLQKVDPALPQAKNKYAVALGDAATQGVIFAEVLIEPEFTQPSLSAAEIRAQNGVQLPPVPLIPDAFTIQLYNPDQQVVVRGEKSTWTGKESWEFEMPQQSFRMPSTSKLDRQQSSPDASILTPKITFKWKRDSKFSKDMTCYMTGKSVGGRKSKDPDITVALCKNARQQSVTIYEPNLQRVEVEDRKGLELVLLLGAEVIREIYLFPSRDSFNLNGAAPNRRKNSRPTPASTSPQPNSFAMTSAIGNAPPAKANSPVTQQSTSPHDSRAKLDAEAETRRLQALAQQEEREREKRDRAEQKRIKRMLEEEEKERRRREAEIEKETDRLRREFGMEGQDFGPKPNLPPRPTATPGPSNHAGPSHPMLHLQRPVPPPRPLSAEPRPRPNPSGCGSWFLGATMGPGGHPPQNYGGPQPNPQPNPQPKPGRRRRSDEGGKIFKKKSTFF